MYRPFLSQPKQLNLVPKFSRQFENFEICKDLYGKPFKRDWVAKVNTVVKISHDTTHLTVQSDIRISYSLRTSENFFWWPFHSYTILEAYLINSLRFSEVDFSHFTAQARLFFVQKMSPRIFGFKKVIERGMKKILTFVIRQIASKILGKIILKPLLFRKHSSPPRMTEQV